MQGLVQAIERRVLLDKPGNKPCVGVWRMAYALGAFCVSRPPEREANNRLVVGILDDDLT
jgi:hypothetical protein